MAALCSMWWSRLQRSQIINKTRILNNKCQINSNHYIRLCSTCNNKTDAGNVDRLSLFEKMLREKRRQIKKSVLVHVYSKFVIVNLYHYCQRYGNIAGAFHYSLDNDKDFVLMEFETEEDVRNLLSETRHFHQGNIVPMHSNCLWFQEIHQGKDFTLPTSLESYISMPDSEVLRTLQEANSVADQMAKLHQNLQLTDKGRLLRLFVCHQLELAFSGLLTNCTVLPFGSSVNGFGKQNCDLDMVLSLKEGLLAEANQSDLANKLFFHTKRSLSNGRVQSQRHLETLSDMISSFFPGCSNVQRILHARVPIVKFHHDLIKSDCDLSMCNLTGVYMSELLYLFGEFDKRLNQLVFTILKWAKQVGLTHDSPGKWITNFSLILMVVFFLQSRPQPVLPSLSLLQQMAGSSDVRITDGIDCTFLRHVDKFPTMSNQQTIDELLLEFFCFYMKFNFTQDGLSTILGRTVSKPEYSPLYIENPLEVNLNVSKNVSREEVERIVDKMKTAVWTLENSQVKKKDSWGLVTLFDVNGRINEAQLKRFPLSTLFDKKDTQSRFFNEDGESQVHQVSSPKLNNKMKIQTMKDLLGKLELDKRVAAASRRAGKKQINTSRHKKQPKNKMMPSNWTF